MQQPTKTCISKVLDENIRFLSLTFIITYNYVVFFILCFLYYMPPYIFLCGSKIRNKDLVFLYLCNDNLITYQIRIYERYIYIYRLSATIHKTYIVTFLEVLDKFKCL